MPVIEVEFVAQRMRPLSIMRNANTCMYRAIHTNGALRASIFDKVQRFFSLHSLFILYHIMKANVGYFRLINSPFYSNLTYILVSPDV